ncbi:MAG: 4-demethylwyosine synthase TYW1, partial [Candidatus Diapherotrites archaeon]
MIDPKYRAVLERQRYGIAGNHSAVKTCGWCRKSLRGEGTCYKEKFYGIRAHRCVQMTPALLNCNLRCLWCWRAVEFTKAEWGGPVDTPAEIVDACLAAQKKLLSGFGGYENTDKQKLAEAEKPLHFAISLIGEPTIYPKLPALVKEIHSRGMKTFIVTNGTCPE